jgi:hypothetical protein
VRIGTVRRSNTLRHSFLAESVLHPSAKTRQGRTNVRREAVKSLDEPWHRCDVAARKECLSLFASLSVRGTGRALRKNAGSLQRLQRSSRRLWQELPLIADGNLPAELKTRGWNSGAGSDPEPRRAFWPRKTGTNRGRSRPRCGFSRVAIVLGFSLGVLGLQQVAALSP